MSKPGAEVKVTVGKPEVLINGESRPLDVPPMIYQGNVLVPVRVISETWAPTCCGSPTNISSSCVIFPRRRRRPPPTSAPPPPPPTPRADAETAYKDLFVAGDYIISPHVYNEFANSRARQRRFVLGSRRDGVRRFQHPVDGRRRLQ